MVYVDKDRNTHKISAKADKYIVWFKPKDQRQSKDDKLEILKSVLGLGDYQNVFNVLTDLRTDTRNQQAKKDQKTISDIDKYTVPYLILRLTPEQVNRMRKHPDVKSVTKEPVNKLAIQTIPWGIDRVNTQQAWQISEDADLRRKGDGVLSVVQDTGVDGSHEDLDVFENISFTDSPIDQFPGAVSYHGTHVAGSVAARDNDIGVVGVAPSCLLIANKIEDSNGALATDAIIESWTWCLERKVQVINHSWGAYGSAGGVVPGFANIDVYRPPILDLVGAGVCMIAAYANDGIRLDTEYPNFGAYPASFQEVVAVTAIDRNNNRAMWDFPPPDENMGSNYGISADLAAPGKDILSTMPGNQYEAHQGTSMACPHVAGCYTLALSNWKWNDCNPVYLGGGGGPYSNHYAILRQLFRDTADKMGKFQGRHIEFGFGVAQVDKVVEKLLLTA